MQVFFINRRLGLEYFFKYEKVFLINQLFIKNSLKKIRQQINELQGFQEYKTTFSCFIFKKSNNFRIKKLPLQKSFQNRYSSI